MGSLYTFGEDACARVYAGSGSGAVYRLISTDPASAAGRLPAARRDADRLIDDEPGQEISLRDPQGNDLNGQTLQAGMYTVQVDDTSTTHNFHLEGLG